MTIVSNDEAVTRLLADHEMLFAEVRNLSDAQLTAARSLASGPLGEFCDSLHDLVAHVLMWDEINLAVMTEAASGRAHWSLDPRWETPDAGMMLNHGGVEAGRLVPGPMLLHRLEATRDALLAQFARHSETWTQAGSAPDPFGCIGELAQHVWTASGQPAYWHAAIHLDKVPAEAGAVAVAGADGSAGQP